MRIPNSKTNSWKEILHNKEEFMNHQFSNSWRTKKLNVITVLTVRKNRKEQISRLATYTTVLVQKIYERYKRSSKMEDRKIKIDLEKLIQFQCSQLSSKLKVQGSRSLNEMSMNHSKMVWFFFLSSVLFSPLIIRYYSILVNWTQSSIQKKY